jgi:hypothetical protein
MLLPARHEPGSTSDSEVIQRCELAIHGIRGSRRRAISGHGNGHHFYNSPRRDTNVDEGQYNHHSP